MFENDAIVAGVAAFVFILLLLMILLIRGIIKDWKRDKDKITFLNKKAFIISASVFLFILFFGIINLEPGIGTVLSSIGMGFGFSLICYSFLWGMSDDSKYPDGNATFENNVQFVLEVQKNNYKVPFPGTVEMYKKAKHDMEQYMAKHGITKVAMGRQLGLEVYYEFESPEAKAEYFKDVQKPTPEDNFWK